VKALSRKLLRELWLMRGQAAAIAVVIGGGVATLIMSLSSLDSLSLTRDAFYREYRFAHLFAQLKRAPESLREAVEEIPGVLQVETRVRFAANLDIPDFADPATGMLLSVPDGRNSELNRIFLRTGRLPAANSDHEAVVSEAFAEAHDFEPGDRIGAVINGRRQTLEIVGIGLSPEFIYQIRPGDLFPDFERYGVLWMNRTHLANAADMEGAFNDVVVTIGPEAREGDVIDRLDELLDPYGGLGAIGREDQISHRYLRMELEQLANMARIFPTIFLGVAAFLLNVVINRLISTQRDQIAILKAFGRSNLEVGWHYTQLVVLILLFGLIIGLGVGLWIGRQLAGIYMDFFRFPFLEYQLRPQVIAIGALVTLVAGLTGTLFAVRRAITLPPAEAMRPEAPPTFRATIVERLGLQGWFSQPTRMILRNLERRPLKAALSVLGIAFACGILMVGRFQESAIDYMLNVQFGLAQRDDLSVTFIEPTSRRVVHDLAALPGVQRVEPLRRVAATLHHEHRSYRTAIQGFSSDGDLRRLLDTDLEIFSLPREGVVLTDYLAELLGVGLGDALSAEILEGRRETVRIPVVGLIKEYLGVSAYMDLEALYRLVREGATVSGAWLSIDEASRDGILRTLKEAPRIAGVSDRESAITGFYETMGETVLIFTFFSTLLAGSIAFGVVYNSARIALGERSRELASLRVLGFTRGEICYILVGELALMTLLAIPVGFLVGRGLTAYMVQAMESDLYRIPVVINPSVYAFAATVVLISAVISAAAVARRLYRLDLVAVLKTRE